MCGVVGLIGASEAAREAFLGLTTLQHRGQDAAGILSHDSAGFHRVRNIGLVESVFTRENMENLTGDTAIGHARYSTIGRGDLNEVQPFLIGYPFGLGMVHNGNIVNCREVGHELKVKAKRHLLTQSDTEVVLALFSSELAKSVGEPDLNEEEGLPFEAICTAIAEVYRKLSGSYSIVTLIGEYGLLAFRDPHGIRPLVWGKRRGGSLPSGEAHMVASESAPLFFLGYEKIRDLAPGEILYIDRKGKVHSRVIDGREPRPCMFEWVYFASPESELDGVPVYGARIQLGHSLARLVKNAMRDRGIQPDLIVPVPETSRIASISLAEELGIPYRELLIKNRYIKRTFILDSQEKRQKAVNLKLSPVRSEIQDKKVMLVDDSIVRGTTSKKIIDLVRKAGASEVYFVSTCPPIRKPCFYGIDFPDPAELIASGRDLAEIEKELGADAVIYQDMEGLVQSVTTLGSGRRPCTACLDGQYPTDVSAGLRFAEQRNQDRTRGGQPSWTSSGGAKRS